METSRADLANVYHIFLTKSNKLRRKYPREVNKIREKSIKSCELSPLSKRSKKYVATKGINKFDG